MVRAVRATSITCHATDDDDVDEIFLHYNGRRIWPSADGTVDATPLGTYPINSDTFDLPGRFSLRDDEGPWGSDSLGWVDLSADEPVGPDQHADFIGTDDDGHYTLNYRIGETF